MAIKEESGSTGVPERKGKTNQRRMHPLAYIGSVVLLAFIIVAFVFLPINSMPSGGGSPVFGSYAGTPIEFKIGGYFNQLFQDEMSYYSYLGYDESDILRYQAAYNAFQATVTHLALLKSLESAGVSVSDQAVNDQVINNARFQKDGLFDTAAWNELTATEKQSLREVTKARLLEERVRNLLISLPSFSKAELAGMKDMFRQQRSFDYVSFLPADYPDSEVIAYAQKTSDPFRTFNFSILTLASKEAADAARKEIVENKISFEDKAKAVSTDTFKDAGGLRGRVQYHVLAKDYPDSKTLDALLTLKKGDVSIPLAVPTGFALFKANDDLKPVDTNDAASLAEVRSYILANERSLVEDYLIARATEFTTSARSASLEQAATQANRTIKQTNSFPINFGGVKFPNGFNQESLPVPQTTDGQNIADAQDKEAFFKTAFGLKKDEISEPILLYDEVVVLRLKEEKTLSDEELGGYATSVESMLRYFFEADLQSTIVNKDLVVDNFSEGFRAAGMIQDVTAPTP